MYARRVEYVNNPKLIELCLNCAKPDCDADKGCEDYYNKIREIEGRANIKHFCKLMDFRGEMLSLTEIAEQTGINRLTIYQRMKKGMTLEEAVKKPVRDREIVKLEYNGEMLSIHGWALKYCVSDEALRHRIRDMGMTLKQALIDLGVDEHEL